MIEFETVIVLLAVEALFICIILGLKHPICEKEVFSSSLAGQYECTIQPISKDKLELTCEEKS